MTSADRRPARAGAARAPATRRRSGPWPRPLRCRAGRQGRAHRRRPRERAGETDDELERVVGRFAAGCGSRVGRGDLLAVGGAGGGEMAAASAINSTAMPIRGTDRVPAEPGDPNRCGEAPRRSPNCTRRFSAAQRYGDGSGTPAVACWPTSRRDRRPPHGTSRTPRHARPASRAACLRPIDELVGAQAPGHDRPPSRLRRLASAWSTLAFTAPTLVPTMSATSWSDSSVIRAQDQRRALARRQRGHRGADLCRALFGQQRVARARFAPVLEEVGVDDFGGWLPRGDLVETTLTATGRARSRSAPGRGTTPGPATLGERVLREVGGILVVVHAKRWQTGRHRAGGA